MGIRAFSAFLKSAIVAHMNTALALDGDDLRAGSTAIVASDRTISRLQWTVRVCAGLLAALGVAVLVGWQLNYAPLICVLAGHVSMKPNTALGFVAAGLALAARSRATRFSGIVANVLATVVVAVGALVLGEYFFGRDFGIDQWLYADRVASLYPGRMAALSAGNFVACGVALYLVGGHPLARRLGRTIALCVAVAALAAIVGSVYGVEILYGSLGYTAMALHTGIGFLLLGLALCLLDAESRLVWMLWAQEDGGTLFRRALPGVVLVPLALGWVYLRPSVNLGSPRFGMALFAVTLVCAGTTALWYAADFLTRAQRQRLEVELAVRHRELLKHANRQLEQRASTDVLTGLKNRGEFELRLRKAFDLARSRGWRLAALMIDVDDFKRRNDTWGHAAGDRVLQTLGAILSDAIRDPDLAARYGGEEFAVLLLGSDGVGARLVAERIRSMIAALEWAEGTITLSIGIGSLDDTMVEGSDLLRAADNALYRAKRSGKDRVCILEPVETQAQ
jgi:diguanylate cyclase (GGDEF)-like protein